MIFDKLIEALAYFCQLCVYEKRSDLYQFEKISKLIKDLDSFDR
jgi:hypothetical protein